MSKLGGQSLKMVTLRARSFKYHINRKASLLMERSWELAKRTAEEGGNVVLNMS